MTRLSRDFRSKPFAHRGLHGSEATENSMAAVHAAIKGGFGIEIDIQPAGDGTPMVFHDYELSRLTGTDGRISDTPMSDLQNLSLPCGGGIPTLEAVLTETNGTVPLLIEIKDQDGHFGANTGTLEASVAKLCEAYTAKHGTDSLAVMSFNPHSVKWFRKNAPTILRGLVACEKAGKHLSDTDNASLAAMEMLPKLEVDFVSYGWKDLPTAQTKALSKLETPVFCWTIRSEEEAKEALIYCDQITFEGYTPLDSREA